MKNMKRYRIVAWVMLFMMTWNVQSWAISNVPVNPGAMASKNMAPSPISPLTLYQLENTYYKQRNIVRQAEIDATMAQEQTEPTCARFRNQLGNFMSALSTMGAFDIQILPLNVTTTQGVQNQQLANAVQNRQMAQSAIPTTTSRNYTDRTIAPRSIDKISLDPTAEKVDPALQALFDKNSDLKDIYNGMKLTGDECRIATTQTQLDNKESKLGMAEDKLIDLAKQIGPQADKNRDFRREAFGLWVATWMRRASIYRMGDSRLNSDDADVSLHTTHDDLKYSPTCSGDYLIDVSKSNITKAQPGLYSFFHAVAYNDAVGILESIQNLQRQLGCWDAYQSLAFDTGIGWGVAAVDLTLQDPKYDDVRPRLLEAVGMLAMLTVDVNKIVGDTSGSIFLKVYGNRLVQKGSLLTTVGGTLFNRQMGTLETLPFCEEAPVSDDVFIPFDYKNTNGTPNFGQQLPSQAQLTQPQQLAYTPPTKGDTAKASPPVYKPEGHLTPYYQEVETLKPLICPVQPFPLIDYGASTSGGTKNGGDGKLKGPGVGGGPLSGSGCYHFSIVTTSLAPDHVGYGSCGLTEEFAAGLVCKDVCYVSSYPGGMPPIPGGGGEDFTMPIPKSSGCGMPVPEQTWLQCAIANTPKGPSLFAVESTPSDGCKMDPLKDEGGEASESEPVAEDTEQTEAEKQADEDKKYEEDQKAAKELERKKTEEQKAKDRAKDAAFDGTHVTGSVPTPGSIPAPGATPTPGGLPTPGSRQGNPNNDDKPLPMVPIGTDTPKGQTGSSSSGNSNGDNGGETGGGTVDAKIPIIKFKCFDSPGGLCDFSGQQKKQKIQLQSPPLDDTLTAGKCDALPSCLKIIDKLSKINEDKNRPNKDREEARKRIHKVSEEVSKKFPAVEKAIQQGDKVADEVINNPKFQQTFCDTLAAASGSTCNIDKVKKALKNAATITPVIKITGGVKKDEYVGGNALKADLLKDRVVRAFMDTILLSVAEAIGDRVDGMTTDEILKAITIITTDFDIHEEAGHAAMPDLRPRATGDQDHIFIDALSNATGMPLSGADIGAAISRVRQVLNGNNRYLPIGGVSQPSSTYNAELRGNRAAYRGGGNQPGSGGGTPQGGGNKSPVQDYDPNSPMAGPCQLQSLGAISRCATSGGQLKPMPGPQVSTPQPDGGGKLSDAMQKWMDCLDAENAKEVGGTECADKDCGPGVSASYDKSSGQCSCGKKSGSADPKGIDMIGLWLRMGGGYTDPNPESRVMQNRVNARSQPGMWDQSQRRLQSRTGNTSQPRDGDPKP